MYFPLSIPSYSDAQSASSLSTGEDLCCGGGSDHRQQEQLLSQIRSPLFPPGPSPPGERWGWPESCSQLEVINTAGNPSQAAISETLRGREGKRSPDTLFFTFLSSYSTEKCQWETHVPFFSHVLRKNTPGCKSSTPFALTPYLSPPLPLQLPPNIPDHPLPSVLPTVALLGEGFLRPKPRRPPCWDKKGEGYGQDDERAFS